MKYSLKVEAKKYVIYNGFAFFKIDHTKYVQNMIYTNTCYFITILGIFQTKNGGYFRKIILHYNKHSWVSGVGKVSPVDLQLDKLQPDRRGEGLPVGVVPKDREAVASKVWRI